MRVALLTTGQTERRGLPLALESLFPGHQFQALEDRPSRPFRSFTSNRLPLPLASEGVPTSLDKLVAEAGSLVDPAVPDRWDLVVIFDDLELANRDQPQVVVDCMRAAVEGHLQRHPARASALAEAYRERVSFHLAVPMIEAWFFGAPHALTDLGVGGAFHIRPGDPEEFESTDAAYAEADPALCVEWCRRRMPRGDRPKWVAAGTERRYHPKGYLQWLLRDPRAGNCTRYDEGGQGADALARIRWDALLRREDGMGYARALVDDLAAALGQEPCLAQWAGTMATVTRLGGEPSPPLRLRALRNL